MQILDKRSAMAIPPLLRLGFRPFFLGGAVLALLAIPVWLIALSGGFSQAPLGGWLAWHRHELLFGFAGAIIAGFLLTAVQSWTGQPGLSGRPLAALALLWLLGRLSWFAEAGWLLWLSNVLFLVAVAVVMGRTLYKVKQTRNYPIVLVLGLLALVDGVTLNAVLNHAEPVQRQGVLGGLWLVVAMMTLIGGRVIPFFTQRGLGRLQQVPAQPKLDGALLGGSIAMALLHVSGLALSASVWMAALFIALGAGHACRFYRWLDKDVVKVPLLWSLHASYLWLIIACVGFALWHLGVIDTFSQATHALAIGAMAGMILAMLARVSLGHTGRPLQPPAAMNLAFMLLNAAALSRVLLTLVVYQDGLWLAGLCWASAFGLFLWHYAPMLCQTRVDGHPG
ncbi:NnrS family protein [Atopomonas sediminilitoris]|uniref:NnrS family protein n=1 Tax=Atopomonas sediminilitoris TaxID=2919919 RepID=UPI001F4D74BE|nr:NnrS family protein [Atopomonas sediminilitoris]MCJ8168615.1 NnrS family protein [Atopomonas sediminilitoris]